MEQAKSLAPQALQNMRLTEKMFALREVGTARIVGTTTNECKCFQSEVGIIGAAITNRLRSEKA
ncbi:hypothetical protein M1D70_06215 [Paenibacillus sp. AK002]